MYQMVRKAGSTNHSLESLQNKMVLSEEQRRQQRRDFNFQQLLQGRIHILSNDECILDLAKLILNEGHEERELKKKLLVALSGGVVHEDQHIRERAITVLIQAGERAYRSDDNSSILLVIRSFIEWLSKEDELLAGIEAVMKHIEELTGWLLDKALWEDADKVLMTLHDIATGKLNKESYFKNLAGQALRRIGCDSALEKLCNASIHEGAHQQLCGKLLVLLGPLSIPYLLRRSHRSLNRKERALLLQLLASFGKVFLQIAEAFAEKNLPWSMRRDILFVLGEMGSEDGYRLIRVHLDHEDFRVQHEALCSLVKISGGHLNSRLLEALDVVDEDLKPYVLQILSEKGGKDPAVLVKILEVLRDRRNFSPDIRDRLICGAVVILKGFADVASVEMVRELTEEYRRERSNLQLQLEETLQYLKPQLRHRLQRVKVREEITFDDDPQSRQKTLAQSNIIEEEVRRLLRNNDLAGASYYLSDQAAAALKERNFILAETLRDRLLQINPMKLNEVVVLGEQIESAKTRQQADVNTELWSELIDRMGGAEGKAFHSLMHQEEVAKGNIVVNAGESDHALYFLETGFINIHCRGGGKEHFLKRVGPGTILGAEQFFSPSVWTVTLKAATDLRLLVIDGSEFSEIADTHVGLEQTLKSYCEKFVNIPELLKMSGDERREFPRFDIPLFTRSILIDPFGNLGKRSFRGELVDISRNGLCFVIKISSRTNGKLLLGRRFHCSIEESDQLILASCSGRIVRVRYLDSSDKEATIHVQLTEKLEKETFDKLLSLR
jgi:CRISPR/Cas system-associated exonuclease Cas4 (RecB family)